MRTPKGYIIPAVLFSGGLSAACLLGRQLELSDHLSAPDTTEICIFLVRFLIWSLAAYLVLRLGGSCREDPRPGVSGLRGVSTGSAAWAIPEKAETADKCSWKRVAAAAAGLCALNLPVLLGVYPGFFVYDAQTEVTEVMSRSFTTHHPLLHVLLLGGTVVFIHKLTASYDLGIFLYLVLQMAVMNTVFSYTLEFMRRKGAGKAFRTVIFFFYGLFPTVVMYTLCSCKDGLFSAFLILTCLLLHEDRLPAAAVSATLMILFRHNGFYAWLAFVLIMLAAETVKALSGKASSDEGRFRGLSRIAVLILPLVVSAAVNAGLGAVLHAGGGEHQEMLTVPIQQLARTYRAYGDGLSEAEKEDLFRYLPEEAMSHYNPRLSDITKLYFNNEAYDADPAAFWSIWARGLIRHPLSYVNAWFLTSYGYWYPYAVINVYKGNQVFTFTYEDSSYFGYETEPPGVRKSLIPAIDSFYRRLSIERFQQEIPVVRLFFSPGALFWACLLLTMGLCANSKKGGGARPEAFLPVWLVWLTVLLGPTYLVRYTVYLWYLLPVSVTLLPVSVSPMPVSVSPMPVRK